MITAVKLYILCESYYRLTKTNVFYLVINVCFFGMEKHNLLVLLVGKKSIHV